MGTDNLCYKILQFVHTNTNDDQFVSAIQSGSF